MAFQRYCPAERRESVLHYFEQAVKHAMKYEGQLYIEFLRRVINFPRRNVINPFHPSPNFAELVNSKLAPSYGATASLPKGVYFDLDSVGSAKRPYKKSTRRKMATGRTRYKTKGPTANIALTTQEKGQTTQRYEFPNRPPTYNVSNTETYFGADSQPLSGRDVTKILEANAPEALTVHKSNYRKDYVASVGTGTSRAKSFTKQGKSPNSIYVSTRIAVHSNITPTL